jgi:biotin operon repressor
MNIFDDLFSLQRIDYLIRTRATGTPKDLADRLGISECSIYRLIDRLKDHGFPIVYDRRAGTYYYTESVKWNAEFVVGHKTLLSIKGGRSNFQFFPKLSFFDRTGLDICSASSAYGAQ